MITRSAKIARRVTRLWAAMIGVFVGTAIALPLVVMIFRQPDLW
jgi:hypothetical protein